MPLIKNYINGLPSTAIQKSVCSENYQQLGQNMSTHDKCQSPFTAYRTTTIQPTFTRRTSGHRLETSAVVNFVRPVINVVPPTTTPITFFFFFLLLHLLSFIQTPCSNHLQTTCPVTTVNHLYTLRSEYPNYFAESSTSFGPARSLACVR